MGRASCLDARSVPATCINRSKTRFMFAIEGCTNKPSGTHVPATRWKKLCSGIAFLAVLRSFMRYAESDGR